MYICIHISNISIEISLHGLESQGSREVSLKYKLISSVKLNFNTQTIEHRYNQSDKHI